MMGYVPSGLLNFDFGVAMYILKELTSSSLSSTSIRCPPTRTWSYSPNVLLSCASVNSVFIVVPQDAPFIFIDKPESSSSFVPLSSLEQAAKPKQNSSKSANEVMYLYLFISFQFVKRYREKL